MNKFFVLYMTFLFAATVQAKIDTTSVADPQFNCALRLDEIVDKANDVLDKNGRIFPEEYIIQGVDVDAGSTNVTAKVEGFFRPGQDLNIDVDKNAKMQLHLNHNSDLVYLCVYYNTHDLDHTHISLYFLEGSNLAKEIGPGFTAKLDSLFTSSKIKFTNAPISFQGLDKLPDVAQDILQKIPGVNIIYALLKGVIMKPIDVLGGTVLDIARLKIEGIVLTPKGIDIKSNIENGTNSVINDFIN